MNFFCRKPFWFSWNRGAATVSSVGWKVVFYCSTSSITVKSSLDIISSDIPHWQYSRLRGDWRSISFQNWRRKVLKLLKSMKLSKWFGKKKDSWFLFRVLIQSTDHFVEASLHLSKLILKSYAYFSSSNVCLCGGANGMYRWWRVVWEWYWWCASVSWRWLLFLSSRKALH